jgi:carboxymethylenebutenolidase
MPGICQGVRTPAESPVRPLAGWTWPIRGSSKRSLEGEQFMDNEALTAETLTIAGHGGDEIEAYLARPTGTGPFGGVVVIHHMPGYDSGTKEIARKFAAHGYAALVPNLYYRDAPDASPDDAAAAARAKGGVPDERLVGDVGGAAEYLRALPDSNGKVGVIGYCSGGRQSLLAACSLPLDAAVDCYGAFVVNQPPEGMPLKVTPIVDKVKDLSCPLLGLFGADDQHPSPQETAQLSKALDEAGKAHEFHTYDGAGHAFFSVDRTAYRPEAARDGWQRIWDFFGRYLAG